MSLQPGARLGPYEILSPLGAGGMGEVWKAKDTRLDRFVAVKVLPEHLAKSPEALARFEREAKAVAALNHPNITGIFDIGNVEGLAFVAMELLEGESLRTRLESGPLTPKKATELAIQLAQGLAAAHDKGVVHRDLKPDNLWITKEGRLKILDFGLAKQLPGIGQGSDSYLPTAAIQADHRTEKGMILGTLGYMSPEQVRGASVDARSDIFSFGVVLFEMLTGKRAFARDTAADTMAAILKEDPPDLEHSSRPLPPGLQRVLQHCLEKSPNHRFQDAHDLAFALENALAPQSGAPVEATPVLPTSASRRRLGLGLAVLMLLGFSAAWWFGRYTAAATKVAELRFSLRTEDSSDQALEPSEASFAISPDCSHITYVARGPNGAPTLWVRALSSLTPQVLATGGTGGDTYHKPFWSPDGHSVAFTTGGKLKRIALKGGEPITICDLPGGPFSGGAWHPDGFILFGLQVQVHPDHSDRRPGLYRVPASGGAVVPFTWLQGNEVGHGWPMFLPDGRHFLYKSWGAGLNSNNEGGIHLATLDGKPSVKLLASNYKGAWLEPDWLVYVRGTALVAQRLNLSSGQLVGEPRLISETLATEANSRGAAFATSPSGAILFRPATEVSLSQLVWVDRHGNRVGNLGEPSQDISVALSPDGTRAALSTVSGRNDLGCVEPPVNLWILDLLRNIRTRFTFIGSNSDENPTWSPDGRRIAFASHQGDKTSRLLVKDASGGREAEVIPCDSQNPHPLSWSPDGSQILLQQVGTTLLRELATVQPSRGTKSVIFESGFPVSQGQFSPDGRFIAFTSEESGRQDVFVRPFPKGEGKWLVSRAGGAAPRWRKDGKELFYLDGEGVLWTVPVRLGSNFELGKPVALFKSGLLPTAPDFYGGAANYDVNRDGTKFLMLTLQKRGIPPPLNVVLHWTPENEVRP